jgi:hypothetical protein
LSSFSGFDGARPLRLACGNRQLAAATHSRQVERGHEIRVRPRVAVPSWQGAKRVGEAACPTAAKQTRRVDGIPQGWGGRLEIVILNSCTHFPQAGRPSTRCSTARHTPRCGPTRALLASLPSHCPPGRLAGPRLCAPTTSRPSQRSCTPASRIARSSPDDHGAASPPHPAFHQYDTP